MENDVVGEAVEHLRVTGAPEYQWMFTFAGLLKGRHREGKPSQFHDLVQDFAQRVRDEIGDGDSVDWWDTDAVMLEFEKAWQMRKFAQDSSIFDLAVEDSRHNPLNLDPNMNAWVSRVVNLAFCLQEAQPGTSILIPVNKKTAEQLGTTLRTLGLAVGRAIELGYIKVEKSAVLSGPKRKARRLTFNYQHPELVKGN